jgi:hypothetical protein
VVDEAVDVSSVTALQGPRALRPVLHGGCNGMRPGGASIADEATCLPP